MIKKYQIFKETLKKVIQDSELDIGVIYFILKDLFIELESVYYAQINKELIEEAKENADSKDKDESVSDEEKITK